MKENKPLVRRSALFVFLLSMGTLSCHLAFAEQWNVFDPRAMAMGGTGVASANGAVGDYWNPASLGQADSPSGFQFPVGAHANIAGDVLQGANNLSNTISNCGNSALCYGFSDVQNDLNMLTGPGNGALANFGAGTDFKFGHIAFFINELGYGGAQGELNGATETSIANNQQNNANQTASPTLNVRALAVTEAGFGYGHEVPHVPGLYLGGNLKALVGYAGYDNNCLITNSGVTNLSSCSNASGGGKLSLKNAFQESVAPGVDLGALWDVDQAFKWMPFHPKIGITGRDINDPTFSESQAAITAGAGGQMALGGNVRGGISLSPFHWWNISADVDLTRNVTLVDGLLYQMAGIGTEINIFNRPWMNLALRAGLEDNIASPTSALIATGGFGLNIFHLNVDLGVQITPQMQYLQSTQGGSSSSQQIPSDIAGSLQIGLMF